MKKLKWLAAPTLILTCATAFASSNEMRIAVPDNPKYQEECGSCHMAYPPKFLTADNWQRMMDGLNQHFGQDATLNARDQQAVLAYLLSGASNNAKRHSADSLRISDTKWFRDEHHELSKKVYASTVIKSPSNCVACHAKAERGVWHEGREHASNSIFHTLFNGGYDGD